MKTEDEILKDAFRENAANGEELKLVEGDMRIMPTDGFSKFEMAVLMAMQGYCQFSTTMTGSALIEGIVTTSVKTAKATLIAIEQERIRLFPKVVSDPADDEEDLPY